MFLLLILTCRGQEEVHSSNYLLSEQCDVHRVSVIMYLQYMVAKVGTRYFFLSPLPLVRYLEIVLPLRAGPLFSKIF